MDQLRRHLFPVAIGSALGAMGIACGAEPGLATAKIVAQLVSGLAINYASGGISPLLGTLRGEEGPAAEDDLTALPRMLF